jgi:hypothetical protein
MPMVKMLWQEYPSPKNGSVLSKNPEQRMCRR